MPSVAKVACRYSITGGVSGVWTFHAHKGPDAVAWTGVELALLAQRVEEWWNATTPPVGTTYLPMRAAYPPRLKLDAIEASAVSPALGPVVVRTLLLNNAGLNGGNWMLPPQSAFVVGLRTTLDSRRGRGRIYWPAITDSSLSDLGPVIADERHELARRAAHLARRIIDLSPPTFPWALCVFSRVENASRAVTHFEVGDWLGSQRRRRPDAVTFQTFGLSGEP